MHWHCMLIRAHTRALTNILLETDKLRKKKRKKNANTGN